MEGLAQHTSKPLVQSGSSKKEKMPGYVIGSPYCVLMGCFVLFSGSFKFNKKCSLERT